MLTTYAHCHTQTAIRTRLHTAICTWPYAHGHTHTAIRTRPYAHGHTHKAIRTRPYAHATCLRARHCCAAGLHDALWLSSLRHLPVARSSTTTRPTSHTASAPRSHSVPTALQKVGGISESTKHDGPDFFIYSTAFDVATDPGPASGRVLSRRASLPVRAPASTTRCAGASGAGASGAGACNLISYMI